MKYETAITPVVDKRCKRITQKHELKTACDQIKESFTTMKILLEIKAAGSSGLIHLKDRGSVMWSDCPPSRIQTHGWLTDVWSKPSASVILHPGSTCQSKRSSQSPGRLQLVKNARTEGSLCPWGILRPSPFSLHSQGCSVSNSVNVMLHRWVNRITSGGLSNNNSSQDHAKQRNIPTWQQCFLPIRLQSNATNGPLESPVVNFQNKEVEHQSWDFNKLTPACDITFA